MLARGAYSAYNLPEPYLTQDPTSLPSSPPAALRLWSENQRNVENTFPVTQAFGQPSGIRPSLLSYSNIGENRQNTFLRFEDAGRNALTHEERLEGGKLIVYQYLVEFSQLEFSFATTSWSLVICFCRSSAQCNV